MTFQIVNVATPNSVHNTCCHMEIGDSVTNLHVAFDCFRDQVEHLHGIYTFLSVEHSELDGNYAPSMCDWLYGT